MLRKKRNFVMSYSNSMFMMMMIMSKLLILRTLSGKEHSSQQILPTQEINQVNSQQPFQNIAINRCSLTMLDRRRVSKYAPHPMYILNPSMFTNTNKVKPNSLNMREKTLQCENGYKY